MKLFKAFLISLGIVFSIVAMVAVLTLTIIFLGYIWFLVVDALILVSIYTYLIYSSMRDREKLKKELEEINNG